MMEMVPNGTLSALTSTFFRTISEPLLRVYVLKLQMTYVSAFLASFCVWISV